MKKRVLSILLCLCMALSLLPTGVLAGDGELMKTKSVGNGSSGDALAAETTTPAGTTILTPDGDEVTLSESTEMPMMMSVDTSEVPTGVTAEVIGEAEAYTYIIYANGNPLLVYGVDQNPGYVWLYIDNDRDGLLSEGDTEVTSLPGVYQSTTLQGAYWVKNSWIFGGCKDADLTGDTLLTAYNAALQRLIPGGRSGDVTGKAELTVKGGSCDMIYATQGGTVGESSIALVDKAEITGTVFGGGQLETSYVGKAKVVGDTALLNNVFGGGVMGKVGAAELVLNDNTEARFVCGGGQGAQGSAATCDSTTVTVEPGVVFFSGWNTDRSKKGGGWLYGGGELVNAAVGSVTMNISYNSSKDPYYSWPAFYGGGSAANVTGNVSISLPADIQGDILCAGYTGTVGGTATVTMTGKGSGNLYGGSNLLGNGGASWAADKVAGTTTMIFRDVTGTTPSDDFCNVASPSYFDEVIVDNACVRMSPAADQAASGNLTMQSNASLQIIDKKYPITGNFEGAGDLSVARGGILQVGGTISGTTALKYFNYQGGDWPSTIPVIRAKNGEVSNFTSNLSDYVVKKTTDEIQLVKGDALALDVSFDKAEYRYGDTVHMTITPTFKDGTSFNKGNTTVEVDVASYYDLDNFSASTSDENSKISVSDTGVATVDIPLKNGMEHTFTVYYEMNNQIGSTSQKKEIGQLPLTIKQDTLIVPDRSYNESPEICIPAENLQTVTLEGYLEGDSGAKLENFNKYGQMATADAGENKLIIFGATAWNLYQGEIGSKDFEMRGKYYVVPPVGLTVNITKKQFATIDFPVANNQLTEGQVLSDAALSVGSVEFDFAWENANQKVDFSGNDVGYAMVATLKKTHQKNYDCSQLEGYNSDLNVIVKNCTLDVLPAPVQKQYVANQKTTDSIDLSVWQPYGKSVAATDVSISYVSATTENDELSEVNFDAVTKQLSYTANFKRGGSGLAEIVLKVQAVGKTDRELKVQFSAYSDSSDDTAPPSVTVPVSSDEGKVSVSASVSGSTATITVTDQQLAEIASNTASTGTVTVDLSGLKNVDSAKIPAKVITAANAASGSEGLEIILPTGTVKLDKAALTGMTSLGKDITVSVETVKTSTLTTAQKDALGEKLDSAVVVDINVLASGTKVTSFNGGTLTVSFPYTPKAGEDTSKLTVWYIKDDGTIEKLGGHYDAKNKCFVFDTTHLSKYVLVSDTSINPFTDVASDTYYYDAVQWAVSKGVTSGTTATTFAPNITCTRGQAVTFLWRAMGSPEPTATATPFTDVKTDAYDYKAVLWAVEKGITAGTSATTFSPHATVSRAQVATFLWRAAGKPAASQASSFTDVSADAYYSDAVLWAAEKGITGGISATTFAPANDCTRGQIVTFLYRYLGK